MHISQLSIVNYRNFSRAKLLFNGGVNTVIGENGSGKSNMFRVLRMLLDENMRRSATRLESTDFHRGLGDWRGHWVILALEFEGVSTDEAMQTILLHNTGNLEGNAVAKATYNLIFRPKTEIRKRLGTIEVGDKEGFEAVRQKITVADYETVFTGRSTAEFTDPDVYKAVVGDFDAVSFPEELHPAAIGTRLTSEFDITREVCFTFIQALRDVVTEFQNSRSNPLLALLKGSAADIEESAFAPIVEKANEINAAIEGLAEIKKLREDIKETVKDTAGEAYSPTALSIRSELSSEPEKLFQALRLMVGESPGDYLGAVHELSLGGANLIYITLKILEFKYQRQKESLANFLVIEEPEAHIHNHIQKTLFDRLKFENTQIIYSTHSTQISEVSNVQSVNVLAKTSSGCEVYQPATGLGSEQVGTLQRYLDAVRSNLLFAKSVVLVEGDAEEILIPILVKQTTGLSLDELGISLVNVRSTGFENVAQIFHNDRIRKRCAILTDLDAAFVDTADDPSDTADLKEYKKKCRGSEESGALRRTQLDLFTADNQWLKVFYAPHTFEVDFAEINSSEVATISDKVYKLPTKITQAKADLLSGDIAKVGKRVLTMAENVGKGWFAILLGGEVGPGIGIPTYIVDALLFACGEAAEPVILDVLKYRKACADKLQDGKDEALKEIAIDKDCIEWGLISNNEVLKKAMQHGYRGIVAEAAKA